MISTAYAQTTAPAANTPGFDLVSMLPLMAIFVVFYFLMIRPQQKKMKEMKTMLAALQNGDEIVTASGIVGKIAKLGDQFVAIEIAPNTTIHLQRQAIQTVLPKDTIKNL